jgi:hypothetical protein
MATKTQIKKQQLLKDVADDIGRSLDEIGIKPFGENTR